MQQVRRRITREQQATTFDRICSEAIGVARKRITPHSARVTGARTWYALGLSTKSIMTLGDWKTERILMWYLGNGHFIWQMSRELRQAQGKPTPAEVPAAAAQQVVMLPEVVKAAISQIASVDPSEMSIVTQRRPRHWHRTCLHGPSTGWTTSCGSRFNPATMVIQRWSEFQPSSTDMRCESCRD